ASRPPPRCPPPPVRARRAAGRGRHHAAGGLAGRGAAAARGGDRSGHRDRGGLRAPADGLLSGLPGAGPLPRRGRRAGGDRRRGRASGGAAAPLSAPHLSCGAGGEDRLGACPPCLCSSSPSSSWWASAPSPSPSWCSAACSTTERPTAPMPISLDTSLPPSLYPLAWLIGSWEGSGALSGADGTAAGPRDGRIEQQLVCTAREDGALDWRSTIHRVDAPAPLPPTSAFAREEAQAPPAGSGERTLLHREDGIWTVGDLVPGQ